MGKTETQRFLEWQHGKSDGFYAIVENPLGVRGCLSVYQNGYSWTPIPEWADADQEIAIMRAAQALHHDLESPDFIPARTAYLGECLTALLTPPAEIAA